MVSNPALTDLGLTETDCASKASGFSFLPVLMQVAL